MAQLALISLSPLRPHASWSGVFVFHQQTAQSCSCDALVCLHLAHPWQCAVCFILTQDGVICRSLRLISMPCLKSRASRTKLTCWPFATPLPMKHLPYGPSMCCVAACVLPVMLCQQQEHCLAHANDSLHVTSLYIWHMSASMSSAFPCKKHPDITRDTLKPIHVPDCAEWTR